MNDDEIASIIEQLTDPHGPEVIAIGTFPEQCLAAWPDRCTDDIVITRGRRNHHLRRHREMHQFKFAMIVGLVDPDEIHRNKTDVNMAIVYTRLSESQWVRTAVIVAIQEGLQNSIASSRLAREREVMDGRKGDRQIWKKR